MLNLVYLQDYDIKGINYYWARRELFKLSVEELHSVGVFDERPQLDASVIKNLQAANKALKNHGYELFIKDAYRSPELYNLVFAKRSIQFGKDQTSRIFNLTDMPHASGTTLDASLLDLDTSQEIDMRNKADDPEAYFIDFYKDKPDLTSQEYQRLQVLLRTTMLEAGFRLGTKNEYWHFELNT
jgi:D-alanyl-D-alanine dipeptidase